ncbi:MAG: hypothetical protein E7K72_24360, partial [Roseomonas mucosa]|nr:hypothetical protein [Roseomonas mucosa]
MTSTTIPARNRWPAFVLGALLGLPLASPVLAQGASQAPAPAPQAAPQSRQAPTTGRVPHGMARIFAEADSNRDGRVTWDEAWS